MNQVWSKTKRYLQWVMLGGVLFFFAKAFSRHWQEIAAIRIDGSGMLFLGLGVTLSLIAFAWSGIVWHWTLGEFKQKLKPFWLVKLYLKTHIAKYLPGHVWHYCGRIWGVKQVGVPGEIATISVIIEPFLMIAAALTTAIVSCLIAREGTKDFQHLNNWGLQVLSLLGVMLIVHPKFLNPALAILGKFKGNKKDCPGVDLKHCRIERYPVKLLIAELIFVALRTSGFIFTFAALHPVAPHQIMILVSGFSLAWLAALVLPGAPGGVGVFEAAAMMILSKSFSPGVVLSVVAVFRVVTILAEAIGAGLAYLSERRTREACQLALVEERVVDRELIGIK
ncbi:lysylphosphatidylglycerol synthase transmembrane domain-containing protein [Floridanema evergladense]|uniref:YbhN family protein n=1 Tax=Floridaenema evergladense BLCC-F167 TaxID=3153639 RepID=A0ABV4WI28_9CYAN